MKPYAKKTVDILYTRYLHAKTQRRLPGDAALTNGILQRDQLQFSGGNLR